MTETFPPSLDDRPERLRQAGLVRLRIFIGGFAAMAAALLFLWCLAGLGPVNPNTATRDQLLTLPGVGSETADRILKLRPFADEADFAQRLAGLGPQVLEQVRTRLDFDGDGRGDCCVH